MGAELSISKNWAVVLVALACMTSCGSCEDDAPAIEEQDTAVRVEPPAPDGGMPCGGCMNDDDECEDGTADEACGADGASCVACRGAEVCLDDGSCGDAPTCGPGTCDGCCDSDGACIPGTADDACGIDGAACATCGTGTACDAGVCADSTACGPMNCGGCCDTAGNCQQGGDDAVCGANGGLCSDCTATATSCAAGTCAAPQSCAATCQGCCAGESCVTATNTTQCGGGGAMCMACGAGEACTNGTCAPIVASGLWDIILVSATISPTKNGGAGWDPGGGLPDPFLEIAAVDAVDFWYGFSNVFTDTLNPVWNETVLEAVSTEAIVDGIEFWFQDDEFITDDICHEIVIADPATMAGQDIVTTCFDSPATTYTWRIEPSP